MDRREMMRASALPALALPVRATGETPSPAMSALASYMSGAAARALPADVLEQTKYHVLDTVSAMIAGSELLPGRAALRYAKNRAFDRCDLRVRDRRRYPIAAPAPAARHVSAR